MIDDIKINFNSEELWVLNVALAIIMFGIALDIRLDDFKKLWERPKIFLVGAFSQFVVYPFFTFLLVYVIQPHPSIALGMILIGACPGGNVSNFFSKLAKGNVALSVSLTAFATLISVLMTPLNFHIYGTLYAPTREILKTIHLDPFALAKLVVLILGIPLIAGMLVGHFFTLIANKISKILKPLSMVFFLILIIMAFRQNWNLFLQHIYLVFWLVVAHNLMGYLLGFYTAKSFKLNYKDRKTIAIETGIQNSGLGLLLIFGFFHGMGGMALLAAFWGVWDIFSGYVLALFWSRDKD